MLNEAQWAAMLDRQREHEDNAMAAGAKRFRDQLAAAQKKNNGAQAGAARKLLQDAIVPLENAIASMIEESKQKPGRKHGAVKWCVMVGPDVAAYMAVKAVLDTLSKRASVRRVSLTIAEMILDELRFRRLKEQAPGLFEYAMGKFTTSNYAHQARSLGATANYASVDMNGLELSVRDRIILGVKLIDLLIESTGIVTRESTLKRTSTKPLSDVYLAPTPETAEWLNARNAALEFLRPVNLPMVMPPLPWSNDRRGGYRFALRGKYPFVRGITKAHQQTIRSTDMPVVFAAVNRIQETPWRVNLAVLQAVQDIHVAGLALAGVPKADDEKMPAKPHDIDTNEESRKQWRRKASAVKDANHERSIRAKEFVHVLAAALAVKDEPHIFFPFNVDFRGRIYPISTYLNPQGSDLSKALLTFAQGKPLGEDGAVWLATHGANCLGETPDGQKVSKMTIQERVDWIVAHTEEIEMAASYPLGHTWWAKADEPLQFLAFCFEWSQYAFMQRLGKGNEFVCSLPCAMDGSCNGLQHFSAMLRDEVGAKAVNVLPNERPHDIYQIVADHVMRSLEANSDNDLALLWLKAHREFSIINRKITKRPTMTFGYGSKKFGFRKQIIEDLKGRDNAKALRKFFTTKTDEGKEKSVLGPAAGYLSGLIWEALRDVVIAAFGGMAWMQSAARAVVASGKCVTWKVPATGFPVRQEYMIEDAQRVETILCGRLYKPYVHTPTDEVNIIKQANAVSPNFVHSLDAAALMLTVEMASNHGVENFAMVHDSYGTLPADCEVLARSTRQAFVKLYSQHDVIGTLFTQFVEQADEKVRGEIPAPPAPGKLDLNAVLLSDYFFA